jgi:mono/diheme cytochrome c family protein
MHKLTLRLLAACALWFAASASTAAPSAAVLERGKYLMEGVVACGNCHMARGDKGQPLPEKGLSGGMLFDEPPFKAYASNITPDPETGIGKWTDAQLARAIREGVRPDKSIIGPPMPVEFYRQMSDTDLAAIIAYLRAQPAVKAAVPRSRYNIPLPPNYGPPVKNVKAPLQAMRARMVNTSPRSATAWSATHPARPQACCSTTRLGAGGQVFKGPWGESTSRNLTPHATGLKDFTDAQIIQARSATEWTAADRPYKPPMGFAFYKNISDADMAALVSYLRSLKPQPFAGK